MSTKRKRGNGEGSISKRKDGRWVAVATVSYDDDGKPKRKFLYGKTRTEVAKKLNVLLSDVQNGITSDDSDQTLKTWLGIWFRDYSSRKIKQSTRSSYDMYIHKHIFPEIGNLKISTLTPTVIQRFYNKKIESGRLDGKGGLNPKTLKNIHNMLHAALDQAVKNDIIAKNPCNSVVLPPMKKKEIQVLSVEDQSKLIDACRSERLGFGITLTLHTGLRLGELLGLKWCDVDFENRTLSVNRTLNRLKSFDPNSPAKTEIVIGIPKTKNSMRRIPLSELLVEKFTDHKAAQDKEKTVNADIYIDQDFVFANIIGMPIEPRAYQDVFKRALKKGNVADINFHALRHTFATRALELNIPAKIVSQILGHATIQLTLDLYSHVTPEHMRESMEKISSVFE
jgi:integrase